MMRNEAEERIAGLGLWRGPIAIEPVAGGLSNRNFRVVCDGESYLVRLGGPVGMHPIDRRVERATARIAAEAGLAPPVVLARADMLVLRFVAGRLLEPSEFGDPRRLALAVDLLLRLQREMAARYRGPLPDRRLVRVLRHYRGRLARAAEPWRSAAAAHDAAVAAAAAVLTFRPAAFAHGDCHPGNIIDDGRRLWLVDFEFAGRGDDIGDFASLSINVSPSEAMAEAARDLWARASGVPVSARDFAAARLAAALRDLFWGYAQGATGNGQALAAYVAENENRVAHALATLVDGASNKK